MKILLINCHPDLSYFTKRGLNLEIDYATCNERFPLQYLYEIAGQNNQIVKCYTPFPDAYLNRTYKDFQYSLILVGFKETDYPLSKNTGGYSYWKQMNCGTFWATVRSDNETAYAVHELHHLLCFLINLGFKDYTPKDYMDGMMVNGVWTPYYKNNDPEAPDGNHATTWNNIKKWLPQLNAITYKPVVTVYRDIDTGKETIGQLVSWNNGIAFQCKTLELSWKDNKKNISCIPEGTYQVKYTFSPKFLKFTYEIQNVPNRSGIRIHVANYFSQINGCIALGNGLKDINKDGQLDVVNSTITVKALETILQKKPFTLIIKHT